MLCISSALNLTVSTDRTLSYLTVSLERGADVACGHKSQQRTKMTVTRAVAIPSAIQPFAMNCPGQLYKNYAIITVILRNR